MAAIVIVMWVSVVGVWLTLVLTHNIEVSSLGHLAAFLGTYLAGAGTPLVSYWKEKRITFDLSDSDPPATIDDGGPHG